jgi:hypothetical protein
MKPTRIRFLLVLAALSGVLGWAVAALMDGQSGRALPVPVLAAATLWLLAIAVFFWALMARPRLQRKPGSRPMAPIVAARTAALAMAASRTGAIVAGFYAGVAAGTLPDRLTQAGSHSLWAAGAAAIGALALVGAALWLEHLCRLPSDGAPGGPGLGKVST